MLLSYLWPLGFRRSARTTGRVLYPLFKFLKLSTGKCVFSLSVRYWLCCIRLIICPGDFLPFFHGFCLCHWTVFPYQHFQSNVLFMCSVVVFVLWFSFFICFFAIIMSIFLPRLLLGIGRAFPICIAAFNLRSGLI